MDTHSSNATRKRVALYVRVSTADQAVENQFCALREHAARASWDVVAEFSDVAVSGSQERRPALDALLREARRRRFDLIAVTALDRLGRNLRHLVTLLDELQHLGVGLVSLREALDLSSPIGRAMFALVGVAAVRRHHAKIMLGVLKIPFRDNAIPQSGCFPCERKIFFHDLAGIATDRRAIIPASLVPGVPARTAIAAPLRALRIGTLSHSVRVQTHPFLRSTLLTADCDHGQLPAFADAVTG